MSKEFVIAVNRESGVRYVHYSGLLTKNILCAERFTREDAQLLIELNRGDQSAERFAIVKPKYDLEQELALCERLWNYEMLAKLKKSLKH